MSDTRAIPVFPLPLTALPGQSVALHIFEERFKQLIADCQAREAQGEPGRFAIFYSQQEACAPVGTVMRIARVLKTYEDGRVDLIALGNCRCTARRWLGKEPYPQATLDSYADESPDWDEGRATAAVALHRRLMQIASGQPSDDASYSGKSCLSFYLAPTCGLKSESLQRLLSLRSENERLDLLIAHLESLIRQVESVHCAMHAIQSHQEMLRLLEQG